MRLLFWLLAVPTTALGVVVLLLTLSGTPLSAATPLWLSALAAAGVLALVLLAWRTQQHGRALLACGLIVISWVAFAGAMLVNGIVRTANWH